MKFLQLKEKINQNLFTMLDIEKKFNLEKKSSLNKQVSRFVKRGLLVQIKKGLYCFNVDKINEFKLANELYGPSYVSLESALNYYGIIPDVPQGVTSINPTTTKKITNQFGVFYYHKIKKSLFWGYKKIELPGTRFFSIARKEKALLDFFYLRKIKKVAGLRLDLSDFDFGFYKKYVKSFPGWVQKIEVKRKDYE